MQLLWTGGWELPVCPTYDMGSLRRLTANSPANVLLEALCGTMADIFHHCVIYVVTMEHATRSQGEVLPTRLVLPCRVRLLFMRIYSRLGFG